MTALDQMQDWEDLCYEEDNTMKKVYKVITGYNHPEGYDHRFAARSVIADDAEKAIVKMKKEYTMSEGEVLESVELVCVIDVE